MILYLAGMEAAKDVLKKAPCPWYDISMLMSFFYLNSRKGGETKIPKQFILDSGAFTFFSSPKAKNVIWEEYVDKYGDFVKANNIERFFELDIDKVVGYDKVVELRTRLEKRAERPCIPVWHKFRGKDNYLRMCDQYGYVSIGGIVSGEIKSTEYGIFPTLIQIAHKSKAKIHGLGFTSYEWLPKCHFDSVDSTSWQVYSRYGYVTTFNGHGMDKLFRGKDRRMKEPKDVLQYNFNEWVKFQKYAETHL